MDKAPAIVAIHVAAERVMSSALGGPLRPVRDDPELDGSVRPRARVMRCSAGGEQADGGNLCEQSAFETGLYIALSDRAVDP